MNFGIISTANIGRKRVIPAIQATEDANVVAIGSRHEERAQTVADDFDIPRAYGSYEELLDDDDLDAVYNPLPNALHAEWTKRAADRGLDILCEKPLGVDAEEAAQMTDYCNERDVVLMEAFMYQYHPRTDRAITVAREHLGELRQVTASFQFDLPRREDVRLDPELAGGSLMDVGCYAITTAQLFLGEPTTVIGMASDHFDCGVDTTFTGILRYGNGRRATISSGFDISEQWYSVVGSEGRLVVEDAYVPDGETTLRYQCGGRTVEETFDPVDQYQLEVRHFIDCIRADETPKTDGHDAVKTLQVIDALRESAAEQTSVDLPE